MQWSSVFPAPTLGQPWALLFLAPVQEAIENKCHATSNKCLTSSNKKLLGTSASLLVTSALLVVTRTLLAPCLGYGGYQQRMALRRRPT